MMDIKIEQFTPVFEALSSKIRIKILKFIYTEQYKYNPEDKIPLSKNHVVAITTYMGLSQPTITHHIKILKGAKLIRTVRKNKLKLLFLNQKVLTDLKPVIGEFIDTVKKTRELRTLSLSTQFAQFSLESFLKAAEFVALHGFDMSKPTPNSNSNSLKLIISRKQNPNQVLFLKFDQSQQLIELNYYDELNDFQVKMADEIMLLFKKYLKTA